MLRYVPIEETDGDASGAFETVEEGDSSVG